MDRPHSWLLPIRRQTPNDSAAYWPDTGFLTIPAFSFDQQLLENVLIDEPVIAPEVVQFVAIAEHEQTHWIQVHAFGYGRFLARIDEARTEIAESFLGLFSEQEISKLLERRMDGHPILQLTQDSCLHPRTDLGPVALRLQRHWWALGLLRHEFDAAGFRLGRIKSTRFRYGLAALYSNAGCHVSDVALLRDKELLDYALSYSPSGSLEKEAVAPGFPWFSSGSIAECAAVLNQHWSYAHAAELYRRQGKHDEAAKMNEQLVKSWELKELTSYADAFRVFLHYNPGVDLNDGKVLSTLNLLCCLSMDGEFAPESANHQTHWRDIYPPLRFCALAKAVKRIGVMRRPMLSVTDRKEYEHYVAELCMAARLPSVHYYDLPSAIGRDTEDSPVNDLRDIIHEAAIAATTLRKQIPAAIICPSEASVFLTEELSSSEFEKLKIARIPPIMAIGGRAASPVLDDKRLTLCAIGGAYQRLFCQLIFDCNPLNTDGLPTCGFGKTIIAKAVSLAEERLRRNLPLTRSSA
jgi:hypothetical protein